jgi:hypothetical protein
MVRKRFKQSDLLASERERIDHIVRREYIARERGDREKGFGFNGLRG